MTPFRSNKPVQHKYPFVFAAADCGTGTRDGLTVHLRRGQVWAADDPIVVEHEGQGLFVDEPPADMLCRSTPDPARLEEAVGIASLAAEVAEADRTAPTPGQLIAY
jgi:hypothetical protein